MATLSYSNIEIGNFYTLHWVHWISVSRRSSHIFRTTFAPLWQLRHQVLHQWKKLKQFNESRIPNKPNDCLAGKKSFFWFQLLFCIWIPKFLNWFLNDKTLIIRILTSTCTCIALFCRWLLIQSYLLCAVHSFNFESNQNAVWHVINCLRLQMFLKSINKIIHFRWICMLNDHYYVRWSEKIK